MRIGIFGGSFNPIHNGHLEIAKQAIAAASLDRVLLTCANNPPHKALAGNVPSMARVDMAYNALYEASDLPIFVCDIEMQLNLSYTVDTLHSLSMLADFSGSDFYLIVGADMVCSFMEWKEPFEICSMLTGIIAVRRKGCGTDADFDAACNALWNLNVEVIVIDDISTISSTQVRERVFNALPIADYVPYRVERIIYENGFYAPDIIARITHDLRSCLNKRRFVHSVSTMREAILIADRYGVDKERCRLAALIHDCAKIGGVDYIELAARANIPLDEYEMAIPALIHAKLGVYKAQTQYNINDSSILNAILYHTTCSPMLDKVGKVVYTADKVEAQRDYPEVGELRRAVYTDLDEGVLACIVKGTDALLASGKGIHPLTLDMRDRLINKLGK